MLGGQGGCERRIEVLVKIGGGLSRGGVGWGWVGLGDQGGCKQRIEVFGIIHAKKIGGGGIRWGVGLVGVQGGFERNDGGRG